MRGVSMGAGVLVWALVGCSLEGGSGPMAPMLAPPSVMYDAEESVAGGMADRAARAPSRAPRAAMSPPPPPERESAPEPMAGDGGGSADEGERVRAWFPEAFLWQPSVHTDDDGLAELDLRVPDQLTTWRVLALAHDRAGHQSGTVHTFDSALPAYVDPVVPGWMYVGDELSLPVQVVNNRSAAAAGTLFVSAEGAVAGGSAAPVSLGAFGSLVHPVGLRGLAAGEATVQAGLGGVDAVRRSWPVHPTGRPVAEQVGGTLTGSRAIPIRWPERADPRTANLALVVHPGPLAVLGAELERLNAGAGASGAYAYGLVGHLHAVGEASGAPLDPAVLRTLRLKAWQRLVREARSADPGRAADLLTGLGAPTGDPLSDTLRARLTRVLVDGQRADGTWSRQDRAPLQRVLVQTAVAARALPQDATGPRLRASGALERHRPSVEDPYTAAVLVATGLIDDPAPLRAKVVEGLVSLHGRRTVIVPAEAASAWNPGPPTRAEVLAWTALALQPTEPDLAGDLVSELMSAYSADRGFGGGPADALALEAVVRALPAVDTPVRIRLSVGDQVVASGVVDPAQPRVPAVLSARPADLDPGELTLSAEPATAGLAWVLTQRSWVPWTGTERLPGVEVQVRQEPLRAGVEGWLELTVAAPSGAQVHLIQGLPAGVAVDVERISPAERLAVVSAAQDRIELLTQAFGAGEVLTVRVPVQPTFAGQMSTRPLELSVAGRSVVLPPHPWQVAR